MAERIVIAQLDLDTEAMQRQNTNLIQQIQNLRAEQRQLMKDTNNLRNATEDQSRTFIENDATLRRLSTDYNNNRRIIAENQTGIAGLNEELSREITNINEAREANRRLTAMRNQATTATEEGRRAIELMNEQIQRNTEFIRENVSEGEQQKMDIGKYKEGIKDAWEDIMNGNVQGGVKDLISNIKGMTAAAWEFIATPIGAAIAVLAGVAYGVKAMVDYNNEIREYIKLTEQVTQKTGEEADAIRQRAMAMEESFGSEFQENLQTAKQLVDTFGISYEQAFDKIENGLIKGGQANGEFFESLKEYDVYFKDAGYSADEFINIVNAGFDVGIYSDKLPDALKEANLALKEQGKSTRDALVNAFGASFADDILVKIQRGEITTKQALETIAQKSKEANLNQQQQAQLTADLFKGAGEDAGGAKIIFDALNKSIESLNAPLTANQQKTKDIAAANEELAKAKDKALKSDSLLGFQKNLELFWVKAQIVWYGIVDAVTDAVKWIDKVTGYSEVLGGVWDSVVSYATNLWNNIKKITDIFGDLWDALGLNTEGTNSFIKELFKAINPLTWFAKAVDFGATILGKLGKFLDANRVNITAFGLTVKSIFQQIAEAVKNFDITKPLESLQRFRDISVTKTFADKQKEAAAIVAANKAKKPEDTPDDSSPANPTPTGGKVTGSVADAAAKAAKDAEAAAKKREEEAKKAEEARKKQQDQNIKYLQEDLKAFEDANKYKQKTAEEALKFEQDLAKKKQDILTLQYTYDIGQKNLTEQEKKNITQRYNNEIIAIDIESKRKQAEIAVKNLQDEAALYIAQNQDRLKNAKTLTEFLVNEEKARQEQIYENEKTILEKRHKERLDSEIEYQTKKATLDANFLQSQKDLQDKFEIQKRDERKFLDQTNYDEDVVSMQERHASEFELELARIAFDEQEKLATLEEVQAPIRDQKLADNQAEYDRGLINEEIFNANKLAINTAYDKQVSNVKRNSAVAQDNVRLAAQQAELSGAANVAGGIAQIAGEQSAVGKAAAIAQATINTYQGATLALASFPGPVGIAMAALTVGSGIASVLKIMGVKGAEKVAGGLGAVASGIGQVKAAQIPKAEKGALFNIGGKRHSQGGTKFQGEDGTVFEAEQGELIGVMNRNAAAAFMDFNNKFRTAGYRTNYMASGGVVARQSFTQTATPVPVIDYDLLGVTMASAVANLPNPVVAVTDINSEQSSYVQVVDGANVV